MRHSNSLTERNFQTNGESIGGSKYHIEIINKHHLATKPTIIDNKGKEKRDTSHCKSQMISGGSLEYICNQCELQESSSSSTHPPLLLHTLLQPQPHQHPKINKTQNPSKSKFRSKKKKNLMYSN